ncbi:MAG: TonB-dependent receptor [Chitinophagaceae bacterium]|nr:TonB-dependent receptor [Chitinophagaceae bacterium]
MKKFFLLSFCLFTAILAQSQSIVKGKITALEDGTPISNATIKSSKGQIWLVDENGFFNFQVSAKDSLMFEISAIGYVTWKGKINPSQLLNINLEQNKSLMQPIELLAVRAADRSPFTKTTLNASAIVKQNFGQDIPFLLNQTPSVVIHSDAGNGVGYTGIRIRGSDASRINVTINGIPYNDAESQGTFFVNLPDFASSLNSIQVQRGVGTSSNGAGAFGATLNLSTNDIIENQYAEINSSLGSFQTLKNTIKVGTGLLNNHFTVDGRLSRISSAGYIDRASSNLQSYYISAAYLNKKSSLRLNVFSGKEKTYQAWNGVSEANLITNRTLNTTGTEKPGNPYDNETDNYSQTHLQLFYNQILKKDWKLNVASFYTRGLGYYEQYKAENAYADYGLKDFIDNKDTIRTTDFIRRLWLNNHFFGNNFSLQQKNKKSEFIIGGGWNIYLGNHYGEVIWAKQGLTEPHRWYQLNSNKKDFNFYSKWQQKISNHFTFFTDLQFRQVSYSINGFRYNPDLMIDNHWSFLNPKLGISHSKNNWFSYLSYAISSKEPNRDDFEAGKLQLPKPEKLHDLELGIERRSETLNFGAAFYYMKYVDQLILTGQINDVGAYTRTNIPNSYRAGIELTTRWKPSTWATLSGNLTYSQNKISKFTAYYDDYDNFSQKQETFSNTDIALSPNLTGAVTLTVNPIKNTAIDFLSKYVSRQYLDNTSRINRSLEAFFVQDIRLAYNMKTRLVKEINWGLQLNNIFNKLYQPNGYTYSYYYNGKLETENFYYPMAGTNFMISMNIKL